MSSRTPRFDVNILPDSYRGPRLKPRQLLLILALLIIVALMVPVYGAVSGVIDEVSDLKSKRQALTETTTSEAFLTKAKLKAKMVSRNTEYEIISNKRGVITDDVQAITSSADGLPIEITSVFHSGQGATISVDCVIPGSPLYEEVERALDDFCDALGAMERFASANPPSLPDPPPASVTIEVQPAE